MPKKSYVKAFNTLRTELIDMRTSGKTWRAIAKEFGISGAMALLIARDGHEPQKLEIRGALHLPIFAPAAVCPIHQVVHVSKRCPSDKPRTPRRKVSRWRDGNWKGEMFK